VSDDPSPPSPTCKPPPVPPTLSVPPTASAWLPSRILS